MARKLAVDCVQGARALVRASMGPCHLIPETEATVNDVVRRIPLVTITKIILSRVI